jgi:hypothetical protein
VNTAGEFLTFPRIQPGRWSEALPVCGLEGKPTGGRGWCAAGYLFSDDSTGKWKGGMGHAKGAGEVGTGRAYGWWASRNGCQGWKMGGGGVWNLRDEKEGGRGGKNIEGHGARIGPITRWEKPMLLGK